MAKTAICFALSHPAVTAVVTGASSEAQVEANVAAADAPALSEVELSTLRTAVHALRYTVHR